MKGGNGLSILLADLGVILLNMKLLLIITYLNCHTGFCYQKNIIYDDNIWYSTAAQYLSLLVKKSLFGAYN